MIIIGEKINGTIPAVKQIIENAEAEQLLELGRAQADAGADYIDVNVGTGTGTQDDEIQAMKWAVATLQQQLDVPLCIDSPDPAVIEAGLSVLDARACMINSTNAETRHLEAVLPLAHSCNARLIALPIDEDGIPPTVESRLEICVKIARACENQHIGVERLLFDPLVLPIATDNSQGRITLDTLAAVKKTFPAAGTVMGLSNISFGLPQRKVINKTLMYMAIYAGLDAAIINPLDADLRQAITAAEAVAGKDRHCRRYIRTVRKKK